jgi:2-polyprenyl-3-methyl-5-hydroxy-6-metoxy-1,4-benzoquinol methylase
MKNIMETNEALQLIINNQVNSHRELFNHISQQKNRQQEYDQYFQYSDIRSFLIREKIAEGRKFIIKTDHPIAIRSNDHIAPWGTMNDCTRSPRFVAACERQLKRKLCALDMGCSGGGIVYDFLHRGHDAVGLEGSDFSLKSQRAEWRVIPDNLFTCDITQPFKIEDKKNNSLVEFDIITMWEVMEHIHEVDLPVMFNNINKHLKADGYFVGSIALGDDVVNGVSYHPTLHERPWWVEKFKELKFKMLDHSFLSFGDYCRGTGNGPLDPNYQINPEIGFHFIAQKI